MVGVLTSVLVIGWTLRPSTTTTRTVQEAPYEVAARREPGGGARRAGRRGYRLARAGGQEGIPDGTYLVDDPAGACHFRVQEGIGSEKAPAPQATPHEPGDQGHPDPAAALGPRAHRVSSPRSSWRSWGCRPWPSRWGSTCPSRARRPIFMGGLVRKLVDWRRGSDTESDAGPGRALQLGPRGRGLDHGPRLVVPGSPKLEGAARVPGLRQGVPARPLVRGFLAFLGLAWPHLPRGPLRPCVKARRRHEGRVHRHPRRGQDDPVLRPRRPPQAARRERRHREGGRAPVAAARQPQDLARGPDLDPHHPGRRGDPLGGAHQVVVCDRSVLDNYAYMRWPAAGRSRSSASWTLDEDLRPALQGARSRAGRRPTAFATPTSSSCAPIDQLVDELLDRWKLTAVRLAPEERESWARTAGEVILKAPETQTPVLTPGGRAPVTIHPMTLDGEDHRGPDRGDEGAGRAAARACCAWRRRPSRTRRSTRSRPLDDAEAVKVLPGLVKQREDSIEQFAKANRPELVAKEEAESEVLALVSAAGGVRRRHRRRGGEGGRRDGCRPRPRTWARP